MSFEPRYMSRYLLAFDFDGTIAADGRVPSRLIELFYEVSSRSCALFLVTGRLFRNASIDALVPYLTGIVWENGAVIEHLPTCHVALPFGTLPLSLVHELERLDIDLIHGKAIAATWAHHEPRLRPLEAKYANDIVVEYNKEALMILPRGANKASGLAQLLAHAELNDGYLVAFGDGENDRALLAMAHLGIAVQDAVPSLKAIADRVTIHPGPDGVAEVLPNFLQDGLNENQDTAARRWGRPRHGDALIEKRQP